LIDARRLGLMKDSAVLVNVARGPVVDEAALVRALEAKRIFAAGLDVFEREPALQDGLAALPNVVLLPHLGSATAEDRNWVIEMATESVIAVLRGQVPENLV
jgi:gluconate 2-dehydrogenase